MLGEIIGLVFFWLAITLYLSSFIFFAAKVRSPGKSYLRWAKVFLIGGLAAEIITIISRYTSGGGFSRASLYELFLFISAFIVLEALVVEAWSKVRILGFYASLLAIILLLLGWSRYKVPGPFFENLKSSWVLIHVTLIVIAYAAFFVAAGAALFYLLQEHQLKLKKQSALQRFLPSLEVLDESAYRSIVFGFIFFTIAIALGFSIAFKFWQGGWDLNILVAAIITWLFYLFYLYSRFQIGWVGKKSSYVAISGIIPLIISSIITYLTKI